MLQAASLAVVIPNKYKISVLPADKSVKHTPKGTGWEPTAKDLYELDPLLFAVENSNLVLNSFLYLMGMANLRPLQLRIFVDPNGQAYLIDRPFKLGGECCCPLEMNLFRTYQRVPDASESVELNLTSNVIIGRIRQDWDDYFKSLINCCFCCTWKYNVERAIEGPTIQGPNTTFKTEYVLVANKCCCGPRNNCCGGTCFKNDAVFSILNDKGEEVGFIQKTFGGGEGTKGCLGAYCRCAHQFDNFLLEFPPNVTTADDRMLILTSVFQIDYHLFEEPGGGSD